MKIQLKSIHVGAVVQEWISNQGGYGHYWRNLCFYKQLWASFDLGGSRVPAVGIVNEVPYKVYSEHGALVFIIRQIHDFALAWWARGFDKIQGLAIEKHLIALSLKCFSANQFFKVSMLDW